MMLSTPAPRRSFHYMLSHTTCGACFEDWWWTPQQVMILHLYDRVLNASVCLLFRFSMRDSVSSEMNTAQYLPQTLVHHGLVINGIISVISSTSDLSTCQESISRTLERLTLWNICYKAAGGKLQLSSIFINSFFPRVFTQYLAIPYSFKPCSAFGWFFIVSNCQVLGKRSSYFRTLVLRKMMYIYFFGLFLAVIIFYKIQLLYRVLQLLITNKMKSLNRHKKIMK